jgi:hypothetical protein
MNEPNENAMEKLTDEYNATLFDTLFLFTMYSNHWQTLSQHKRLNLDFIDKNLQKPWDWVILTNRTSFSNIVKYMHFPWIWRLVQAKPDFDISIVSHCPNNNWDWYDLSKHPKLTLQIVAKNSSKPWNVDLLCKNTMDFDCECQTNLLLSKFCMLCINETLNCETPATCLSIVEKIFAEIYIIWNITHFL